MLFSLSCESAFVKEERESLYFEAFAMLEDEIRENGKLPDIHTLKDFNEIAIQRAVDELTDKDYFFCDVDGTLISTSSPSKPSPSKLEHESLEVLMDLFLKGKKIYFITAGSSHNSIECILAPLIEMVQELKEEEKKNKLWKALKENFALYVYQGAKKYVFDIETKEFKVDSEYDLNLFFDKNIENYLEEYIKNRGNLELEITYCYFSDLAIDYLNVYEKTPVVQVKISPFRISESGNKEHLAPNELSLLIKNFQSFFDNKGISDLKVISWGKTDFAINKSDKESTLVHIMKEEAKKKGVPEAVIAEKSACIGDRCYSRGGKQGDSGFVKGKTGLECFVLSVGYKDGRLLENLCKKDSPKTLWRVEGLTLENIRKRVCFAGIGNDDETYKVTWNILREVRKVLNKRVEKSS